jgi:hypothetical protein
VADRDEESAVLQPRVERVRVRGDERGLALVFEGTDLVGVESGPAVEVDGTPAPAVFFEDENIFSALVPDGAQGRALVHVTYAFYLAGECEIELEPGAETTAVRSDAEPRA